ncbi:MAG: TVP38/TMEM64 family protein [Clostridium sp.]|nr:TVP38/TMEM64 family protein [Clostridium sp.]
MNGMKEKDTRRKKQNSGKQESGLKKKRILAVFILLAFLGVSAAIFWEVGKPLLQFVSDNERLRSWVDDNWLWSRLAYTGIVILQIVVAIIPGEPFEIGAGYAFGAVEGTIICILGSAIGGTLVFLLVKKFGIKLVEVFISVDKINSLKFLKDSRKRDILMFLLFFIPGTPKDVLCYFAGLTNMELKTWLLITTIAKFPSIVTSTIGGNAIGMENYQFAIIVFVVTFLISGAGMLFYNYFIKRKEREAASAKEEEKQ